MNFAHFLLHCSPVPPSPSPVLPLHTVTAIDPTLVGKSISQDFKYYLSGENSCRAHEGQTASSPPPPSSSLLCCLSDLKANNNPQLCSTPISRTIFDFLTLMCQCPAQSQSQSHSSLPSPPPVLIPSRNVSIFTQIAHGPHKSQFGPYLMAQAAPKRCHRCWHCLLSPWASHRIISRHVSFVRR